jgi:hypothetical protein
MNIHDPYVSEAVCSTLLRPWSGGFARRTTVQSHHEQTTYTNCGTEDRSLREWLCWTQEELAKNLRQMRWSIIWKNARWVENASFSRKGNAALRAEIAGFILPRTFFTR